MPSIFFVRHGQSEWNAIQRFQGGRLDSTLSELGRRQAHDNGRLLGELGVDRMFVSPLGRARETAAIISEYVPVPWVCDDRLKEWDCGDWSGHLREEVVARWPDEWAARQADPYHHRGPNCENYPDMFARVAPLVAELRGRGEGERIAVVSHGLIGRVMVSLLLGLGEEETLAIRQPNDTVFHVLTGVGPPLARHYVGGAGPFAGVRTSRSAGGAR